MKRTRAVEVRIQAVSPEFNSSAVTPTAEQEAEQDDIGDSDNEGPAQ